MPETKSCQTCNGTGTIVALVSMHDDVTEICTCPTCNGRGSFSQMTDDEERDYHADYW